MTTTKEGVFKMYDAIKDLENKRDLFGGLNEAEDLELRNLVVKFASKWSDLKD